MFDFVVWLIRIVSQIVNAFYAHWNGFPRNSYQLECDFDDNFFCFDSSSVVNNENGYIWRFNVRLLLFLFRFNLIKMNENFFFVKKRNRRKNNHIHNKSFFYYLNWTPIEHSVCIKSCKLSQSKKEIIGRKKKVLQYRIWNQTKKKQTKGIQC